MDNNSIIRNSSLFENSTSAPQFNLPLVMVLCGLIPLTVIGNSLVCIAFIKYQKLRTTTNSFLFSLAICDLIVGIVLIPLWIALIATGGFTSLPQSFYSFWVILEITCSVASMSNLVGVSIERWYGVCYPFRHMSMSANCAVLASIASWTYSLGVALMYLFYNPSNPWAITVITCLGLCLPFAIMTIAYACIARRIKKKSRANFQTSGKDYKTIRILMLLSAVFIICWLPFGVGSLVVNYCDQCAQYVLQRPVLHIFPKVLHYSNSCVNPILYSLFSPSFKQAFKQMFYGTNRTSNATRRRSTLVTDRSGSGSHSTKFGGSVLISFKEKRKSTFSDGERKNSSVGDISA